MCLSGAPSKILTACILAVRIFSCMKLPSFCQHNFVLIIQSVLSISTTICQEELSNATMKATIFVRSKS